MSRWLACMGLALLACNRAPATSRPQDATAASHEARLRFDHEVRGPEGRYLGLLEISSGDGHETPRAWWARFTKADGTLGFHVDLSAQLAGRSLMDASFAGEELLVGLLDDEIAPEDQHCDAQGQCPYWGIYALDVRALAAGRDAELVLRTHAAMRPIALPDGLTAWFRNAGQSPEHANGSVTIGAWSARSDQAGTATVELLREVSGYGELRADVGSVLGLPLIIFGEVADELARAWIGVAASGEPRIVPAPGESCVQVLRAFDRMSLTPAVPAQDRVPLLGLLSALRGGHEVDWPSLEGTCASLVRRVEQAATPDMALLRPLIDKIL